MSEYFWIKVMKDSCYDNPIVVSNPKISITVKWPRFFKIDGTYTDPSPSAVMPELFDLVALNAYTNPTSCPLTTFTLDSVLTSADVPISTSIFSLSTNGRLTVSNFAGQDPASWTNVKIKIAASNSFQSIAATHVLNFNVKLADCNYQTV